MEKLLPNLRYSVILVGKTEVPRKRQGSGWVSPSVSDWCFKPKVPLGSAT